MENEVFCCVSNFIRILLGETFSRRSARETKKISSKRKKDKKSKTREQKNKGEIREILRETTQHTRRRETHFWEKTNAIFYSFFEMLLHINAVLKIHDKPLLLLRETNRENIFFITVSANTWKWSYSLRWK